MTLGPGRLSYSKLGLSHPWAGLSRCFSFPGGASGKESACQCKRPRNLKFDPWVRNPWSRKWQPTLVFLPEKLHGQRKTHIHTHTHTHPSHWSGTSEGEMWKEWVPELDVKVVRQSQNTVSWVMHQKNLVIIFTLFSYCFFSPECRCLKVQMTLGPKNCTTHIWTNVHYLRSPAYQTKLSSSSILLTK